MKFGGGVAGGIAGGTLGAATGAAAGELAYQGLNALGDAIMSAKTGPFPGPAQLFPPRKKGDSFDPKSPELEPKDPKKWSGPWWGKIIGKIVEGFGNDETPQN